MSVDKPLFLIVLWGKCEFNKKSDEIRVYQNYMYIPTIIISSCISNLRYKIGPVFAFNTKKQIFCRVPPTIGLHDTVA